MWFSSKIRIVCLIEGEGAVRYMDSVYVFRARDFNEAWQVALDLGHQEEEEYKNNEGKIVRWRLKELISLDGLPNDLDRAEVYSEPVPLDPHEKYSFTEEFNPEDSRPTQTV